MKNATQFGIEGGITPSLRQFSAEAHFSGRVCRAWTSVFMACLALAGSSRSQAEITLSIEMIPGQSATPGSTVAFEVFVVSTDTILLRGLQVDFPCVVAPAPSGVGSLSTIGVTGTALFAGQQSNQASGAIPWVFAFQDELHQGGLRLISLPSCRIGGSHGAGEDPYPLAANQRRYVATIRYRISDCAFGNFALDLESRNNPPRDGDLTRITGVGDVTLAFSFEPLGLTFGFPCPCKIDADCDDEMMCSGSEFCSEGWCRSVPSSCPSSLCMEQTDQCAECIVFSDCDDDNPCTTEDCRAGFCFNPTRLGPCDDGAGCTTNDRCRSGICLGDDGCSPGWTCDVNQSGCVALTCEESNSTSAEPASDVVDARQPHPPTDFSFAARQGIGDSVNPIHLTLETDNADGACFKLCETAISPTLGDNAALDSTSLGGGVFRVELLRPITPGAVTTIHYVGGGTVEYVFHPGNVNGDNIADSADVLILLEALSTGTATPHGSFSTDINRTGELDAGDLVREIDLLSGADDYEVWGGTSLPGNEVCP